MTLGSWTYASGLTSTGSLIENIETLVDELIALIQAADAGWSVATASTQYATATGVWARLTHSSGPAVVIAATINNNYNMTQINAANNWDGVTINTTLGGATVRGRVWIAWQPTGVTAPSNDPGNATFFAASTDFRFIPLVVTSNWSSTARRLHVLSTSEGALAIVSQQNTADGTSSANLLIAANDLFSVTPNSGDTYTAGMINITNTSSATTLTLATSLLAGQCLNAAGTGRVALNTLLSMVPCAVTSVGGYLAGYPFGSIAPNQQAAAPYLSLPVAVSRDAADIATTGVAANQGIKGIINPYAIALVPTSAGAKTSLGGGNYICWVNGICSGWKSTNVVA